VKAQPLDHQGQKGDIQSLNDTHDWEMLGPEAPKVEDPASQEDHMHVLNSSADARRHIKGINILDDADKRKGVSPFVPQPDPEPADIFKSHAHHRDYYAEFYEHEPVKSTEKILEDVQNDHISKPEDIEEFVVQFLTPERIEDARGRDG
jgi:hypothetical protein